MGGNGIMKHFPTLSIGILATAIAAAPAVAQNIGGNASLSVTTASSNVAIPSTNKTQYPSVILAPSPGTTAEIFYNFGTTSSVAATTSSPALPAGGICVNIGPATYVAAITATGSGTLRITQISGCTSFSGASSASSGGSVTQGTSPWVVGGPAANGAVPTGNPIWFAGWDGTDLRAIKTDSSGDIVVSATASNASSGVATSSTNFASVGFNYGFNGTTWDQLQVDASKNLKVGPQYSGDIIVNPSSNFTRPANTTAYASGQLVANSTTAGSVTPLSWTAARVSAGNFRISRVRMSLSSKSITNTNFRIHFFNANPGVQNGDGGTFDPTNLAYEVCEMDVTIALAGNDVSMGYGASNQGTACDVALGSGTTLYGLVEARAAYSPGSGETITVIPEIHQN